MKYSQKVKLFYNRVKVSAIQEIIQGNFLPVENLFKKHFLKSMLIEKTPVIGLGQDLQLMQEYHTRRLQKCLMLAKYSYLSSFTKIVCLDLMNPLFPDNQKIYSVGRRIWNHRNGTYSHFAETSREI